jgi:hypothetical protein
MATQTINFPFLAGETGLSLRLRSRTTRAIIDTQSSSESTANNGIQTAAFTDVPAGQYLLQLIQGTDVLGQDTITLTLTTGQFWPDAAGASGGLTTEQAAALERIDAKAALITGSKLSVAGAVTPGGDITLVIGDDRVSAADSELLRSITDTGGALHTRLAAASEITFGAGRNGVADLITGTVTSSYASNVTTLTIEIDQAGVSTDAIASEDYTYQIQRVTADGDHVIEVSGNLTLLDRYAARTQ